MFRVRGDGASKINLMRYSLKIGSIRSTIPVFKKAAKVLIVSMLMVQWGCSAAKRISVTLPEQEGYIASSGGVRIFYRLLGSGADTMVVIHGGPGFTMDYFLNDLTPLAANHTLIFYDQRGTGRSTLVSDSLSLHAERFVDDLEAVRAHFGIDRLTLLGHSWGSAVIALYANRHPDHLGKLILVGGLPLQQHQLGAAFRRMEESRDSSTVQRMIELRKSRAADPGNADVCREYYDLWFEVFFGDRSAAARSQGNFCAGTLESRRNKMASVDRFTMASLGEWDWRSSLRRVKAPTLVIHGTKDPLPLEGARSWAAVLPNSELLLLDGVGHFPYLEVPERFFREVQQFMRRH